MKLAKKNHYNPCFWTAFWNTKYYEATVSGSPKIGSAREQKVYALSVKSGKIHEAKVDDVHYDKNLGVAEITREAAEAFCKKYHPESYEHFCHSNESAAYPIAIDLEQLLCILESLQPYKILLDVIKRQRIDGPMEKVELAGFVLFQAIRSHAPLNSMLQWHSELGIERFESYVTLKWLLADREFLTKSIGPLAFSQWTLFATKTDTFPLCDSPVLIQPQSILVALSPRLLLEISNRIPAREHEWRPRKAVKPGKLAEFRRRTIGNTFREIIFSDKSVLEHWQSTPEFSRRCETIRDVKSYNRLVEESGREIWHVNAFGNQ